MKSILLVDDEAAICAELQRTLCQFGFQVDLAHTFEAALASAGKAEANLILVEFNLASKCVDHARSGGGIRLVREFRDSGITIPILIYTVMEGEIYERASLDAGADDFLLKTKPISELVSQIRDHIERNEGGIGATQPRG